VNKRIRVLCSIPHAIDATSWYRGMGPMAQLQRHYPEIELLGYSEWGWDNVGLADLVFMQRPFNDLHVQFAEFARKMGLPLWVDYDDDLFSVPFDSPAFAAYGNPKVHENVARICQLATYMTVATKQLTEVYKKFCPSIHHIPNAIPEIALRARPVQARLTPREKVILWRGGPTHERDLLSHHAQIMEVAVEFPDWKWCFIGYHPWWLIETLGDKGIYNKGLEIVDYHTYLWESRPSVVIVPLHKSTFNMSKSHIAWLEAAYAGAAAIVPEDIPDFQDREAFYYEAPVCTNGQEKSAADFARALRDVLSRPEELETRSIAAHQQALQHFTLQTHNRKRLDLIRRHT
jgi:glycosyltransferase involved in cell wall biosynthesis